MKKKIYAYFKWVGIKLDIINHNSILDFVDSGSYFVQDENNCINPLLQVGYESESGSGSEEKISGSGSDEKITGSRADEKITGSGSDEKITGSRS